MTGSDNINGTGNAENNSMAGTSGNNTLLGLAGNDYINAGAGNDWIEGGDGNDNLVGGTGNNTYAFSLGDGIDVVTDTSGLDKIKFDSTVLKSDVAIFMDASNNLIIDYNSLSNDSRITVNNQAANTIETLELSNGEYLSNSDINQIVQDMAAYASSHGITISSVDTVQNNSDLMAIVANSWHSA